MELRLLCLLMELLILTKGHAVTRSSGEQILLLCEAANTHARWFWFPLNPKCANISERSVEIIRNRTTHEVTPLRFNRRLIFATPGSLLLLNLVMSDAGTYTCRPPYGSETHTFLQVVPGCHNNLLVSSEQRGPLSLQLTCHHCVSQVTEDSFRWLLNSRRLGNHWWAKKSGFGSTVTINPIRPAAWGRWECLSLANPSWVSEICLSPLRGQKGTISSTHEDFPSTKPTSSAAPHWSYPPVIQTTEATPTGHPINGTPVWIWAVLLGVLVMVPALLGVAVWLWKRKQTDRKHKENRDWTDRAFLRNATKKEEDIMKRESQDERPASLYYAQLQHPQWKSTTVRTPDSTTVYAVIV